MSNKDEVPTNRRSLRYRILLVVCSVFLALLAVETALRVSGYVPFYLDAQAFVASDNADLVYELRPGFRGLYAGVPVTINSRGFRGPELSGRDDAQQVVIVGDSIAFGQGVVDHKTLAEQLRVRLQRRSGAVVDVVNLGVPGYNTCQEYERFKQAAPTLSSKVCILLYCENDTDLPLFQLREGIALDVRTGLFGDLMAALRKHSAVYNLARRGRLQDETPLQFLQWRSWQSRGPASRLRGN